MTKRRTYKTEFKLEPVELADKLPVSGIAEISQWSQSYWNSDDRWALLSQQYLFVISFHDAIYL